MPVFSIGLDASKVRAGAQEASGALRAVADEAGKAEKGVNLLEQKLKTAAAAAVAFVSANKAFSFAKDVTLAAGRYETLGISMYQVGQNAGYSKKEMDGYQASLEKTGIAMTESRAILTQLAGANINLANSSKLARVAQDAAVIGGINSTEAFERLTIGLVKGDQHMLRTIGLTVDFEKEQQKMASTLKKSVSALTEQEKTQARVNAIMEKAKDIQGAYEKSLDSAYKQMTSIPRYLGDIEVLAGKLGAGIFSEFIKGAFDAAKATKEWLSEMDRVGTLEAYGKDLVSGIKSVASEWKTAVAVAGAWVVASKLAGVSAGNLGYQFALLKGSVQQFGVAATAGNALKSMLGGLLSSANLITFGLTAAAGAITYMATREDEATRFAREHADAMKMVTGNTREAADAADAYAKKLSEMTTAQLAFERAKLARSMAEMSKRGFLEQNMYDKLTNLPSFGDIISSPQKMAEMRKQLMEAAEPLKSPENIFKATSDELKAVKERIMAVAAAFNKTAEVEKELGHLTTLIADKMASEILDVALASGKAAESVEDIGGAAAKAARETQKAFETARDAIDKAFPHTKAGKEESLATDITAAKGYKAAIDAELARRKAAGSFTADDQKQFDDLYKRRAALEADAAKKSSDYYKGIANHAASAKTALSEINAEIAKMNGDYSGAFADHLAKKMEDIAKKGQEAKLSIKEIADLQEQYKNAALAEQTKNRDNAFAKLKADTESSRGNDALARELNLTEQIRQKREELMKLEPPSLKPEEAEAYKVQVEGALDAWKQAQEKKLHVQDMQTAVNFLKDLEQMSGQYGLSIETNNKLLEYQAQLYAQNANIPKQYLTLWSEYKKLETAKDPLSGMHRAVNKFTAEAQDWGKMVEQTLTGAFDRSSDALAQFVMTGKANFKDLANSIITDMARMAAKQAMGGLVGALFKGIGGMFGGGSGLTSWTGGSFSGSHVVDLPTVSSHSGGLVGTTALASRTLPASIFALATRLHSGGYIGPDERPAILQTGERVLSRRQNAEYERALSAPQAPAPQVNVNIHTPPGMQAETQQQQRADGGFDLSVILDQIDSSMASGIMSGRSKTADAMRKAGQR